MFTSENAAEIDEENEEENGDNEDIPKINLKKLLSGNQKYFVGLIADAGYDQKDPWVINLFLTVSLKDWTI